MFSTTGNGDASFANNFGFDAKWSDKSFIFIRKKKCPTIEPYGNPTSGAIHEEYCPFRTTLCSRCYKKSVKVFS